jgi:hypothetical protein
MRRIINFIWILPVVLLAGCTKENAGGAIQTGAGGSTAKFTIAGNFLYVVDNTSLKAFDISNPAVAPVLRSKTEIGINIETIFPYQDKLFIGSSFSMYIYSLTDPANPSKLAQAVYQIRMSCDPVVAKDSTAFATLNASSLCGGSVSNLVVYDIRNISNPVLKKTLPLSAPNGLGMQDSALYICDKPEGLLVYDIRNTYDPQRVRTISGYTFNDVIPFGNLLICQVQGGLALYDITNRHLPVFLSQIMN